jgi:hypothetical protein
VRVGCGFRRRGFRDAALCVALFQQASSHQPRRRAPEPRHPGARSRHRRGVRPPAGLAHGPPVPFRKTGCARAGPRARPFPGNGGARGPLRIFPPCGGAGRRRCGGDGAHGGRPGRDAAAPPRARHGAPGLGRHRVREPPRTPGCGPAAAGCDACRGGRVPPPSQPALARRCDESRYAHRAELGPPRTAPAAGKKDESGCPRRDPAHRRTDARGGGMDRRGSRVEPESVHGGAAAAGAGREKARGAPHRGAKAPGPPLAPGPWRRCGGRGFRCSGARRGTHRQ